MHSLTIERRVRDVVMLAVLLMAVGACTEPDPRHPYAVGIVPGSVQQGEVGLPIDVAVQVTDSFGRSVPNASVTFELTTAPTQGFTAGSIEPVTAETDEAGVARTRWTLGTRAGEQTLRTWAGSAGGSTTPNVTVSATARAGAATSLAPASDAIVAITVGDSVRVAVVATDRYGNVASPSPSSLTWQVSDLSVASVSRTELPPDTAAMVVANAGGATVLEARDPAVGTVRFDIRTYVGPGRDIAYWSSGTIYLLSADGGTTTALGPGVDPAWSPDGRQVVFTGDVGTSRTAIYVMNADGSGRRALTDPVIFPSAKYPTRSPDGRKIAFVAPAASPGGTGPSPGSLFTMNADGSEPTLVLRTLSLCSIQCPGILYATWSPDGTKIAYSIAWFRSTGSVGDVFVVNADGSGDRPLVSTSAIEHEAAWSPDARRIVFQSSPHPPPLQGVGPVDLYIVNADGSGRRRLTSGSAIGSNDRSATWSPDGRIAFVRSRSGIAGAELFVINADGTELRRFASIPAGVSRPAWRP